MAQRKPKRRRITVERLESRVMLDAGLAGLVADNFSANQNSTAAAFDVLANDSNADAGVTGVGQGNQGGRLEVAEGGAHVWYTPAADFAGVESFQYFVGESTANVTVDVRPALLDDEFKVVPDQQAHTLELLANDPFWEGYSGPRQITFVSSSQFGADVTIRPDGRGVDYLPADNTFGVDQFVYIVDELYPARARITLDAPLKSDRLEIIAESDATAFDVLANDPFWPGYSGARRLTFAGAATAGAAVEIGADGRQLIYTPRPGHTGWDQIAYAVDGQFQTTASIMVHRPVGNDWFEVDEESGPTTHGVLTNDHYYDLARQRHDIVDRVTSVTQPESGAAVTISPDGQSVVYTPIAGFSGEDRFTYLADGTFEATVRVRVTRPVRDDWLEAVEDRPAQFLDVLKNDFLDGAGAGQHRITSVTDAASGAEVQITADGQGILYSPSEFVGRDAFRYTVDDERTAEVSVNVQPLAMSDYYSFCAVPRTSALNLNVMANDRFGEADSGLGLITAVDVESGSARVNISTGGKSLELLPLSSEAIVLHYTVDDRYSATVRVSQRGAQPVSDRMVVNQNDPARDFDVRANDFANWYTTTDDAGQRCGRYDGPAEITSVTDGAQGGVVEIANQGKSLRYTPPEDFVGRDRFTYVVDGYFTTSAEVDVVRRVRDDQFVVAPNSSANSIAVLANDLFGADYSGARAISEVTATLHGGTVTISQDQQSIVYTPAVGFIGADQFGYVVDGQLKATVDVHVEERDIGVERFESLDAFQDFLIDDALTRYADLFGAEWNNRWFAYEDGVAYATADATGTKRVTSTTNVQVAGVDEADLIEVDDTYTYVLRQGELVIAKTWPLDALQLSSRLPIPGQAVGMYLNGQRLTVLSTRSGPEHDGRIAIWPPQKLPSETLATVIDVSDRSQPTVVQQTTLGGRYLESRAIGSFVYVALAHDGALLPEPQLRDADGNPVDPNAPPAHDVPFGVGGDGENLRYETEDEYLARIESTDALGNALPRFSSRDAAGSLRRAGLIIEATDVLRPDSTPTHLLSLISIDALADEPGLNDSAGVYASSFQSNVYAAPERFYVLDEVRTDEDARVTHVRQFDLDSEAGRVELGASGQVIGGMLNQFSADEYQGRLRLFTSVSNYNSGNYSGREETNLTVLREDHGLLETVGSLQTIGLGERLRAVRFDGDRALAVTFRNIDPLFAIDLSEPDQPRVSGHLTLPGFSQYAQFIGEHHVLTVGRNTPTGIQGPVQVSLFDVNDLLHPRQVDQYSLERFSNSVALDDHHAVGYFAYHNLLSIPTRRQFVRRTDENGDGYRETAESIVEDDLVVFRVDPTKGSDAIVQIGAVHHDSPVLRSGFIDNLLISVAEDDLRVVSVDEPSVVLGALPFGAAPPNESDDLTGVDWHGPLAWAVQDWAARLQLPTGRVQLVTAEPVSLDANGLQVVLRAGDRMALYGESADGGELIDDQFEFTSEPSPWHNVEQPVDTNRDGLVTPRDALIIINDLNRSGSRELPTRQALRQISRQAVETALIQLLKDVNGDGILSPADALAVINWLNERSGASEGELVGTAPDRQSSARDSATPRATDTMGSETVDWQLPDWWLEARTVDRLSLQASANRRNASADASADGPRDLEGPSDEALLPNSDE